MTKNKVVRDKAVQLRKNGYSVDDIAKQLAKPKGTVYYWVKDVEIKKPNVFLTRTRENHKASTRKAAQAVRKKYQSIHDQHINEAVMLWGNQYKFDEEFKLFLMLYMCEGDKKNKGVLELTNTDPNIIRFAKKMFEKININEHEIKYRVQLRDNLDEKKAIKFWQDFLEIKNIQVLVRKSKPMARNWVSEYGIMSIRLCDSYLKTMMNTWMKLFSEMFLR